MSYKATRKVRNIQPGETAVILPGASADAMLKTITVQMLDAIEDQAKEAFGDNLIMLQVEVHVEHTAMVAVGDDAANGNSDDN